MSRVQDGRAVRNEEAGRAAMIQVFYKSQSEPITKNTPFRVLVLDTDDAGQWHVVLGEGIEWGRKSQPIEKIPVKDFDEGKPVFDRLYNRVQRSGRRPYRPQED